MAGKMKYKDELCYFYNVTVILVLFLGSGKTAAFLIPILSRIFEEGPPPPPDVSKPFNFCLL